MADDGDEEREQQQLPHELAEGLAERQAEEVGAEIATRSRHVHPELVAVQEQQPLLPEGGRRLRDLPRHVQADCDEQPLMCRPHAGVVPLQPAVWRRDGAPADPDDEGHGRAQHCQRDGQCARSELEPSDVLHPPHGRVGGGVEPPPVEQHTGDDPQDAPQHEHADHDARQDPLETSAALQPGDDGEARGSRSLSHDAPRYGLRSAVTRHGREHSTGPGEEEARAP